MATNHAIASFEFQMCLKVLPKMNRFIYDYNKGNFKGLRSSLRAANLSNLISPDAADINNDWRCWKDTVLASVADFIPKKKLKGTNLLPWINGSIINLINKKDSIRKKLKQWASSLLREKFRTLRSEIKRRLRECREAIFVDMESNLKSNPKRFSSVLRVKSKPKTSLKRLPWQPVTFQESRPPLQKKLRNYSTSILRQYSRLFRELQRLKGRMVKTQTRCWLM